MLSAFLSLVSHLTFQPTSLSLPCLCLIAECEMTHWMRESARHTQLSGNEKWCWCQRWNRPNHPWAELHNSNIILWLPPPLLSVIAALSSGTLSLAHSQFKQIWFLFLYVPVTSLLLRELCAGIGTRIKSPTIAKHVGKGQEEESPHILYMPVKVSVGQYLYELFSFHLAIFLSLSLSLSFLPCPGSMYGLKVHTQGANAQ